MVIVLVEPVLCSCTVVTSQPDTVDMTVTFFSAHRRLELKSDPRRKQFSSLCTAHFAPVLRRSPLLHIAWSRGILKQRKGRRTMHFNGDSMNTELLFQTIQSVNLRIYGAVARTSQFLCGQQDVDKFTTGSSTTLGISSNIAL